MNQAPTALNQLEELAHDMKTCGFNSYGVKKGTYYNWCNRIDSILNRLHQEAKEAEASPPPPPPFN